MPAATRVALPVYDGVLVWGGRDRNVLVIAADAAPLLEMRFLEGRDDSLRVFPGGRVAIEPLFT